MGIADTVKDIKPTQWALIAGAGIGLGLLLRMRAKAKGTTAATTTDTPSTTNDTQGMGNYSGTGQTGWAGGAIINPNAPSDVGNTPVDTSTPPPPTQPNFPSADPENPGGSIQGMHWRDPATGLMWYQAGGAGWQLLPGAVPSAPVATTTPVSAHIATGNEGG